MKPLSCFPLHKTVLAELSATVAMAQTVRPTLSSPAGEDSIVKVVAPAGHGLEGLALDRDAAVLSGFDGLHIAGPLLADARQLAAGDHGSFVINDSDDAVGGFLKL